MAYTIIIDERALIEIENAIEYYDFKKDGLGSEFLAEITELVSFLRLFPRFRIRYDLIRCAQVRRFPFMLHYTLDELNSRVIIHAALHTSREPINWFVNED